MSELKGPTIKPKESAPPPAPSSPNLVCFTIDIAASRVIKVERLDMPNVRRELSQDDRASLALNGQTVEALIEQAFEAGIGCLLPDDAESDEGPESPDEADLRHALLVALLEKTAAKNLLQNEVLSRAILCTAIQQTWSR